MTSRFTRAIASALCLLCLTCGIAQAHPHVWVTATSELVYAPDGTLTSVRHAWTFDDMFSTYALQGIETKTKGVYTREELAPLAQTNVESLKEFGFFTFARAGDGGGRKKQKFEDPVDYYLEHKDGALVLHFTLPLKTPLKTRQLALEIYDPTYFVAFSFAEGADAATLAGAPQGCAATVTRPKTEQPKTADAGSPGMTEAFFEALTAASTYGVQFASRVLVACP